MSKKSIDKFGLTFRNIICISFGATAHLSKIKILIIFENEV